MQAYSIPRSPPQLAPTGRRKHDALTVPVSRGSHDTRAGSCPPTDSTLEIREDDRKRKRLTGALLGCGGTEPEAEPAAGKRGHHSSKPKEQIA